MRKNHSAKIQKHLDKMKHHHEEANKCLKEMMKHEKGEDKEMHKIKLKKSKKRK